MCACGNTGCASGKRCHAAWNHCSSYPPCDHTDGINVNTGTCTCGNAQCSNNQYCNAAANYCSSYPSCSNTDGINVNTGTCSCGNIDCTTDWQSASPHHMFQYGLICYNEHGTGSCRDNDPGQFGYPLVYDECDADLGNKPVSYTHLTQPTKRIV